MRLLSILLTSLTLNSAVLSADESTAMLIKVASGYDGSKIWAGIVIDDEEAATPLWTSSEESEFSIKVPDSESKQTIVLVKKDAVPIVRQITSKLVASGLSVEFSDGATIVGNVATNKKEKPITKGSLSISFDESKYKFSFPFPELNVWEIEENGSFVIRGVPLGEHVVSVAAPGYMPAADTVLVTTDEQKTEIDFVLPTAEFVNGHMEVHVDRKRVTGKIGVVVTPPESQTVEFTTEFDEETNFRIGPFAEDAELKLVASLPNEQRSLPRKITVPLEQDITLWLYDWVRVFGSVQDQETGEPIPEFSLVLNYCYPQYKVADPTGQFNEEIYSPVRSVSIYAPGYVLYTVDLIRNTLYDVEEIDFGAIELERAFTVKGRVLVRPTREPIKGARIVRYLNVDADIDDSEIMKWNYSDDTTTNADGEFELDGFRETGGQILVSAEGYTPILATIEDFDVSLEMELDP